MIDSLLEHRADVNAQDKDGSTIIMQMLTRKTQPLIIKLLKCGARLDIQDNHNRTALDVALSNPTLMIIAYGLKIIQNCLQPYLHFVVHLNILKNKPHGLIFFFIFATKEPVILPDNAFLYYMMLWVAKDV